MPKDRSEADKAPLKREFVGSSKGSSPMEVPVGRLNEWAIRVRALGPIEAVQGRQSPRCSDPKNRAVVGGSTRIGDPVEIAVGGLHQASARGGTVSGVEAMQ